MSKYGLIYIVSNSEQKKNLFKIGKTSRSIEERIKELNSATGTLGKFKPHATFLVKDIDEMETYIHKKLSKIRYQKNREFFELNYTELLLNVEELISTECLKKEIITAPDNKISKKIKQEKIQLEKEFLSADLDIDNLLKDSIDSHKSNIENDEKKEKLLRKTHDKFVKYQLKIFDKNLNKLVKSLSKHNFIQFYITDKPLSRNWVVRCLVVITPNDDTEKFESIKHHSKFYNPFESDYGVFQIEFDYRHGSALCLEVRTHHVLKDTYSVGSGENIFNIGKFFKFIVLDMAKMIINYNKIFKDNDSFKINLRKDSLIRNSFGDYRSPFEANPDLNWEAEDEDDCRFKENDCNYEHALSVFRKYADYSPSKNLLQKK